LTPTLKPVACTSVLALALLAGAVAHPAQAARKPACWQTLLNDWYDGRIDGTYPIHCYRDALKHLPSDVDTYSSARNDIERALASARLAAARAGRKVTPNTLLEPAPVSAGTVEGVQVTNGSESSTKASTSRVVKVIEVPAIRRHQSKGLTKVADQLDTGGPSSIPLPLYILGGLALLLLALGGAGLLARRLQRRRPGH
jgi:hypothetical protein